MGSCFLWLRGYDRSIPTSSYFAQWLRDDLRDFSVKFEKCSVKCSFCVFVWLFLVNPNWSLKSCRMGVVPSTSSYFSDFASLFMHILEFMFAILCISKCIIHFTFYLNICFFWGCFFVVTFDLFFPQENIWTRELFCFGPKSFRWWSTFVELTWYEVIQEPQMIAITIVWHRSNL